MIGKMKWKNLWQVLLAALLPLVLSGCMFSASAEDLYAPPQLPVEYQALSTLLSDILAGGAEYAAPQGGNQLPPVQMVDLNGDGSDEALAFFRVNSEERPLKIYIFRAVEDDYEQAAVIDGSGTAFQSVRYTDMDGDGVQEILVSWRVSAEVQSLSVYTMRDLEPQQLMSTAYARYEVVDLDGDEHQELVVLRSDSAEAGLSLADYYDWDSGNSALQLQSTARLSMSVAAMQWTQTGKLREGESAVFVTGRDAGVDETSRAITDILVYRQPDLVNIALSSDTGVSTQIFRSLNLQPADVNGDGATEVPRPAELPSEAGEDPYWKIYWHSYHIDGTDELQAATYHNLTDGWYLIIPDGWDGHYTVRQNNASSTVRATTFYSTRGWSIDQELLTIYTLTGTDRESQAAKSGRAILRRRTADTVYAIAYSEAYSGWRYAVDPADVEAGFSVIVNRWNTADS